MKIKDLTDVDFVGIWYAHLVVMETNINEEIAAYDALRQELEVDHMGKWALVHNRELVSLFDSFEAAAEEAVKRFGRGTYLIRQVGAASVSLPASVSYRPDYGPLRLHR